MTTKPTAGTLYVAKDGEMVIVLGTYHNYEQKGLVTYKIVEQSEVKTDDVPYFNSVYKQVKE